MQIEELATRIASAPRGVVIALIALTALISPGFIRATPDDGVPLAFSKASRSMAAHPTAVFELGCADGVFTPACLRFVARVTEALEADARVTGAVRSLTRARVVANDRGSLRLEPLIPRVPSSEPDLRVLRAKLTGDPAQARLFLASGERATRVYAELDPELTSERARALADTLRQRFERAPGLLLSARSLGERESALGESVPLALVIVLAALSLALAPGSWRTSALAAVAALAFLLFAHGLLRLLGEPGRLLGGLLPALLSASAFATSFALTQRVRASPTRISDVGGALAEALAELGPALAIAGVLTASGVALCLALSPEVPLARGLGAAAGLAAGLVVYPLGITIAGLRVWPQLIATPASEFSAVLCKRVERSLARPRVVACGATLGAALVAWGVAVLAPEPDALRLRTVLLDSGARSGALEPLFLERVQAFQRNVERDEGVIASSSFVDVVVAPAYRALHDGDPVFATVPPMRADVERALRPWQRDERRALSRELDPERRRVAVELLEAPGKIVPVAIPTRPLEGALLSLLGVAAIGALALRSLRGGRLCAVPGAVAALIFLVLAQVFERGGSGSAAALAPLSVGLSAAFALQISVRVRSLMNANAELEIAVSLSQREAAGTIASAALAGAALLGLAGIATASPAPIVALGCLFAPLSAGVALSTVPALLRLDRGRVFAREVAPREIASAAKR